MIANYDKQELNPEILLKKLDTILDMEEDLIIILNKSGLITKVNANGALTLQFKEEDLLNRHIIDLIASKYKVEMMQAINDIITGKPERAAGSVRQECGRGARRHQRRVR